MTSITQNLPWFIKDLGVSIIGPKCYTTLIENLDIDDVECLKYSLSKGLGLGLVVGGSIMKLPQLLLIISKRSARGLSLTANLLETLSYSINTTYSFRNSFPFSTYGENFFLAIQNAIIALLIVHHAPPSISTARSASNTSRVLLTLQGLLAGAIALYVLPPHALSLLQLANLPISLLAKVPQIRQNHRARSTGQLSAFAVVAQIGGCLARLFTTWTEVGDLLITAGFALALALNLVLGAQMWAYWGKDEVASVDLGKVQVHEEVPLAPVPVARAFTPEPKFETGTPPRSPTPRQGNRKWARKVD